MTDDNEFHAYLDSSAHSLNDSLANNAKLYVDVPPPPPQKIERAATGLAPMERIALEGKAYRGLASGSKPWWVMVTGWVMFGLPCLAVVIGLALSGGGVEMVGAIAICLVFFWIMYRGTRAKLKQQQRRDKYRREMGE
ncbi:MAG: hypothetical protein AAF703_23790 [Cyanobacteria bacterium P01_D01_bin.105]